MSGRLVNVRPKPGFLMDGAGTFIPARTNVVPMHDGLVNVLTGRGTSVDRNAHNFWVRRFSTPQQVEQAYLASWLHRKIVDIVAEDMTRAGRDWDAADEEIKKIEAEEKRLGYWPKLCAAVRLARLGGGAIFLGLGDDPSQPLPSRVGPGALKYLMVLSRHQLELGDFDTDPMSATFGQPKWFRIVGLSAQINIHPSRMVCFHGLPIPAITMAVSADDRFWGMSVVEAVDEPVQQATAACSGFSALIEEAKVDVYRFSGLVEQLAQPGGEARLATRVDATNAGKSVHRAVVLDKDDEWEQRELTLTGMRDVMITYDARVAGAADIPATRLFGKSPDGQNSTGESDLTNYFQAIGSRQEYTLRPPMERIDKLMLPGIGLKPDLSWTFSKPQVTTEMQEAEIENKEADTVSKLVNTGLVPEAALAKAVQNRLIESQRWPGLQDAIDEVGENDELPGDPEELGLVSVEKGGGQSSAGRGNSNGSGLPRRAVNDGWFLADAEAKPLYVQRKLLNAGEVIAWAKAQGFETTLAAEDMHVTLLYSRAAVDPMKLGEPWGSDDDGNLTIKPGGPRAVEKLGEEAVVLLFASSYLSWRHRDMIEAGGSHDYPEYQPHVTLSYKIPADLDIEAIKPFTGELRFGPEIFEPLDLEWKAKVAEK